MSAKTGDKNKTFDKTKSYVICDPTGNILCKYGNLFVKNHYDIKIFNVNDTKLSMHYNPLAYIQSDEDIMELTELYMHATNEPELYNTLSSKHEAFWTGAARTTMSAIFGYLYYEAPKREQNFETVCEFFHAMEIREEDYSFKNAVDMLFEELEHKNPHHFAVRQYDFIKSSSESVKRSTRSCCLGRISTFDFDNMFNLTRDDELELGKLGEHPTVLFIIYSGLTSVYRPLLTILYAQIFNILYKQADDNEAYNYKLHVPVKIIGDGLNEFNIPYYDKIKAVADARGIDIEDDVTPEQEAKLTFGDPCANPFDAEWYLSHYFKRVPFKTPIERFEPVNDEKPNIAYRADEECEDFDDFDVDE